MARGNTSGAKWTKGGAKRRNRLSIDFSAFSGLLEKLEEVEGDVKEVVTTALDDAGEDIGVRTKEAMDVANLPASGKYSRGETEKSVIMNPQTEWVSTSAAEIGVGFDKLKPGVGSLLITGTPRMRPDYALEKIYVNKKYQKQVMTQIGDTISEAIKEKMEE